MFQKCPKCGEYSVTLDSYFGRLRCMLRNCSWLADYFWKEVLPGVVKKYK